MDFVILLVSLILIFSVASYALDSHELSEGEKRAHFFLLSYLLPAGLALVAGFLGVFQKEFFIGVLLLISGGSFLFKKKLPDFSFLNQAISINSGNFFIILIVAYYLMKAVTVSVWVSLDDSTYHAAIPVQWVQWKSFYVPVLTYQVGFPLNGSLFSSFLLSFVRSEYVAAISELLLISIIASYCSLKKNNLVLLALFFIFSATDVEKYLVGFSDSDILSGVLIYILFSNLLEAKESRLKELLFSSTLGFLFGIKLLNLIFVLPFMPLVIKSFSKFKYKKQSLFLFFLMGTPWYIRNLLVFKNPFFPFEKYGFSGWMNFELINKTSFKTLWLSANTDLKFKVLKGFLGWQPLSYWVGVIFFVLLVACLIKRTKYSLTIFSSLILFIAMFFGAPFSGYNESLTENINSSRYLLPLFIPGILILVEKTGLNFEKFGKEKYLFQILLFSFFIAPRYQDKKIILITVALLIGGFLFSKLKSRKKINILILPILCLIVIQVRASKKTEASKINTIWYLNTINKIEEPKNISMFNHFIFQSYYLAGEGLRHKAFRLREGGQVITATDDNVDDEFFFMGERVSDGKINCLDFNKNLKEGDINILVIEKTPTNPQAKCIFDQNKYSIIQEHKKGFVVQVI